MENVNKSLSLYDIIGIFQIMVYVIVFTIEYPDIKKQNIIWDVFIIVIIDSLRQGKIINQ